MHMAPRAAAWVAWAVWTCNTLQQGIWSKKSGLRPALFFWAGGLDIEINKAVKTISYSWFRENRQVFPHPRIPWCKQGADPTIMTLPLVRPLAVQHPAARQALPVILIAAVIQGWALYGLHHAVTAHHWPATDQA